MRVKTITEPCGCEWQLQEIPRSMHTREIWTSFCPAHDAEEKALRAAAHAAHVERNRIKTIEQEFTQ